MPELTPDHGRGSLAHGYVEGECDDWCNNVACRKGPLRSDPRTGDRAGLEVVAVRRSRSRTPGLSGGVVMDEPTLSLTRTGEENGRIVGVLTTPDGVFQIRATPAAWAETVRDVAAGRNPMLLDTLLTNPREETT